MRRRLPPLNPLRTFEAAARLLSFTLAADELAVTQTAVSHQIRTLEDWFGLPLFRRGGRRLTMTEAGSSLYPTVTESLDRIAEVAHRVSAGPERNTLTISVTPTFGSRWLAERLARFWRRHPDIDLRLHYSVQPVDLVRNNVDAAVRWGRGRWAGLHAQRLIAAQAMPLCSPALLGGRHPLRVPADLAHHTLLHESDYQEWTEWLAAAGVQGVDANRGSVINDPNTIMRAAIDGLGVAIGIPSMFPEAIETGLLVAPFGVELGADSAYYYVCPAGTSERPLVEAFRRFLLEELETDPGTMGGGTEGSA